MFEKFDVSNLNNSKEELEKKNDINIHEINKLDLYKVDYNNNIKKFIDKWFCKEIGSF